MRSLSNGILLPMLGIVLVLGGCKRLDRPNDMNSVLIVMHRSACFGRCPVYSVTMHGNGDVEYDGVEGVSRQGKVLTKIQPADVKSVLQDFDRMKFMGIDQRKFPGAFDAPIVSLSLTEDGMSKTISTTAIGDVPDQYGPQLSKRGMNLTEWRFLRLARRIDEIADTAQWTKCDDLCTSVWMSHILDWKGPNGESHLLDAIETGTAVSAPNGEFDAKMMIEGGANVNAADNRGLTPLMAAARKGDLDLIRDLLAHGANPGTKDHQGRTAADYAKDSETKASLIAH